MSTIISYHNNKLDFWYTLLFIILGAAIQVLCFYTHNESWLSLVSGLSGLLAVVLCASKRMSMYVFSYIQLCTYLVLANQQHLYGEIFENIFYFITLIMGMFIWNKSYDNTKNEVISKQLTLKDNVLLGCIVTILIIVLWQILKLTNDTQPFLDSLTTVPAFVAQILLIFRFREQWIYWLIIDVTSVLMWYIAGDYIMMTQFIFWTINCFYGYYKWKQINN